MTEQDTARGPEQDTEHGTGHDTGRGPEQDTGLGGSESLVTVVFAFAANVAIAIAKSVTALLTGSASMVAEAAHSWADSGNEVFLFIAERRSTAAPDAAHPLGFGRDSYVWSLFAAVGLFTVGAVLSVQHGISELGERGPAEQPVIAYIVLGSAFCWRGSRSCGRCSRSAGRPPRPTATRSTTCCTRPIPRCGRSSSRTWPPWSAS